MRPALTLSAVFAIMLLLAGVVAAGGVEQVVQKGRAFSVSALQITRGDVVHFSNEDKFLHQLFVEAASFGYESDEQEPGTSIDIRFAKAGIFEVRCHIHPKMLLTVDAR